MKNPPVWLTSKSLKSSPYAEPENALLFIKKDARKPVNKAVASIRIVRVNQTKRNIYYRDLDPNFGAYAGTIIRQFGENALANTDDRVGLSFAPKENLLESDRQSCERVNRPDADRVVQLFLGNEPVVAGNQSGSR